MIDLLIRGGWVVDPAHGVDGLADVAVREGKIVAVGEPRDRAKRVIDAEGMVVAPGFLDSHMHLGDDLTGRDRVVAEPGQICQSLARMGVTTAVTGNCGLGPTSVGAYLDSVSGRSPINLGVFAGHMMVRRATGIEDPYASATDEQTARMEELVASSLRAGAFGLSFGLELVPGVTTDEVVRLCRVASRYHKLVPIHARFDGDRALEAMQELVLIAQQTGCALQVSHIGSVAAFGHMKQALALLEKARAEGCDILADCYPYAAFMMLLSSAVFDDIECLRRWGAELADLEIASGPRKGQRLTPELYTHLRQEEKGSTLIAAHVMRESEVVEALQHPLVFVASDGILINGQGHPRAAGTFAKMLGRYVRKEGRLSLSDAIAKMSWLPARRLRLVDKGHLGRGADADLVVVSMESVNDRASFIDPGAAPVGIELVLVNGVPVLEKGELLGALPGKPIQAC